ncbi:hypothetical protein [Nitrosomonas sp.]|uniref:hypothetical protein n=1 Tax=Nitrosomonas sp. TaxID=42353 RepID=UPI002626E82F|nr:hypothetical protein [Nitrosomonas sp.]
MQYHITLLLSTLFVKPVLTFALGLLISSQIYASEALRIMPHEAPDACNAAPLRSG